MHITAARARVAAWIALPIAVVASGSIIATASYAAFSADTTNPGNAWTAGKVTISDDKNGSALFDVNGLMPGDTGENCITVTADTTEGASVKFYTSDTIDAEHLGDTMTVRVERVEASGDCGSAASTESLFSGALADLTTKTSFAAGLGTWDPAAGVESARYRFHYELPDTADNSLQQASATTTFVWEAQQH